ncbi:MAG: cytochrome ubiquinol oxidase subunit I [Thermoguttaceae bacterium]|nr:cytochrome ubiquinol oxidase subunit I [Thermoguttaceae bacterium]
MYYPWLDVPVLTSPMLIAIIALLHVFVSHYAVGGGLLLAVENCRSLRDGDSEYRAYLKKHAGHFIALTLTYGAITGVGIWFFIGIASPLATEVLIKTFVFGWAIEWCFFLLEIVSGLAFYYFWDKLSPRASSFVGMTYAFSAWISLVLITGITSFMLNSGGLIDNWESTGSFWHAFLNVQFIPQTVARTGCALTLSSFYFLFHASLFCKNSSVCEMVTRHMRIPAFLGVFLLAFGVAGWLYFLPESSLATLERASATNIFSGLFVGVIVAIVLILIFGPVAKPKETSVGMTLALSLLGIAGVAIGEFVREAVRKPYVVDRVVYSNQIKREDVKRMRQEGLLYTGVWTNWLLDELQEKEEYQNLTISSEKFLNRPSSHIVRIAPAPVDEGEQENLDDGALQPSDLETPSDSAGDLVSFVDQTAAVAQYPSGGGSAFTPVATPWQRAANEVDTQNRTVGVGSSLQQTEPRSLQPVQSNGALNAQTDVNTIPVAANSTVPSELQGEIDPDAANEFQGSQQIQLSVRELDESLNGPIGYGNPSLLSLNVEDRLLLGRAVFMYHCNCCHAEKKGYSAIAPLLAGRSIDDIKNLAFELNHTHYYMPPWAGTEVEAELLAEFLDSIKPAYPENVFQETLPKKVKKERKSKKVEQESEETELDGTIEQEEGSVEVESVSGGALLD